MEEIETKMQKAWDLYVKNMEIIKLRIQAIEDIRNKKTKTSFRITDIEFCVLQIRKILELIALSALVSDADLYREKLGKIEKLWNAQYILCDIEKIHPKFYPCPAEFENDTLNVLSDNGLYLDQKKFVKIYNRCGKFLHTPSPFENQKQIDDSYTQVWNDIPQWIKLISTLLDMHIIHMYNEKYVCCIEMGNRDELPQWTLFRRIDEEERTNGQT